MPWHAEPTSFVGRRHEVAEVRRMLQRGRLVTVTGVAGVGKTRVAVRAAQLTRRAFADGVVFAELSAITGTEALEQTLVHLLELAQPSREPPLELLKAHLASKRTLLVLDTCEHLTDECSALIQALLPAAPGLQALVTSRNALRAPGEHTMVVRPMAVPSEGLRRADLERTESVALFLDRARPGFSLTDRNAEAVAELCRRMQGIPLAIELAAARVRAVPDEPLSRLPADTAMAAAVAWSHELCTPEERLLWERLTVFSGTFDLAGAERVCAGGELPAHRVFPALAGLVDKSIIIRERDPGHTVYRMLDAIREFKGPAEGLRERHRDHYHALALRLGADHAYPKRAEEWRRLRADWPNVKAALEHPGHIVKSLELGVRLWFLWVFAGMPRQGRAHLERLLATGEGGPPLRQAAYLLLTHICVGQGDLKAARAALESAGEGANVSGMRGMLLYAEGDLDAAEHELTACTRALADYGGAALLNAMTVLGFTHVAQGRTAEAVELLTRARARCGDEGEDAIAAWAEVGLALALRIGGDPGQARLLARSALREIAPLHANFAIAFCVELLGWLAADRGRYAQAARLMAASHHRWSAEVGPLFGSEGFAEERGRVDARVRRALGPRYDRAVAAGLAMSAADAIAYALADGAGSRKEAAVTVLEPLTRRESEVAELVADGLTNRAISQRLVVARRTVDTHVENILAKLGFSGRSQIAAWVSRYRQ
ncbi:ATP-binding protein [Nonomuraea sp. NPDC050556]|uniref:ATP-binding protein n=1 Tax=Nonomuraea sp. NPDC050556 TaxID=3364369 RepID=UPI0037924ECC